MGDAARDLLDTWVRVLSLRNRLLTWYDRERRELPWRRDRDAYRVLVSELMLQQTRVDVVVPYFESFLARWPDVRALAAADLDDVLAAWSGLGYYRRARALHAAARAVVAEHGGVVPSDPGLLRTLPGVGPYTTAAVASIAYDVPVPVVDGNVERVLVRLGADTGEHGASRRRRVEEAVRRLVTGLVGEDPHALPPPEGLRPGDLNQALMELGATICTPRAPQCPRCPWARTCIGRRSGLALELPRRKPRAVARDVTLHMALVRRGERLLLLRRAEGVLLSGLWELPTSPENGTRDDLAALLASLGAAVSAALPSAPLATVRHSITDRRIRALVYDVRLGSRGRGAASVSESAAGGAAWVKPDELSGYGASSLTKKALRAAGESA